MPEGKEIAKIVDMTPYVEPTPDVPFVSTFQWPFQQKSGALTGSEEIASHHRPISAPAAILICRNMSDSLTQAHSSAVSHEAGFSHWC